MEDGPEERRSGLEGWNARDVIADCLQGQIERCGGDRGRLIGGLQVADR